MMRSADECEMSRSCHRATFSSAACAFERTTRASPLICSHVTGFRLCGMADEPFCFSLKYSSASRTSVRCRANFGGDLVQRGRDHRQRDDVEGMAIALNHLRRDCCDVQAQSLTDFLLVL